MKYFIHIGYDGSEYSGWQRQQNTPNTIQEIIETVLARLFKKPISAYGCGRTDAGVHSSQYVIQINLDEAPSFDLKFRLNKNLPDNIAVFEILEVGPKSHCRFDATARTYDYFIHWEKDPILMNYSSFYEGLEIDFNLMQKAAALIYKTKDFKALCKQPDSYDHTICEITNCELFLNPELGRIRFTITSNRFLRGMIRICVFFMLEVAQGKMSLDEFEQILNLEKDYKEKQPAHPNGLFLSGIEYPYLKLKDAHSLISMLKVGLS